MNPIVGNRYHLVGHNYDLCEAEFDKLADKEKALFQKVPPPPPPPPPVDLSGKAAPGGAAGGAGKAAVATHFGVSCDKSGMNPIVGNRYHLRGHDYDLCQAEFDKLSANEKALYDVIPYPPYQCPRGGAWGGAGAGWGGGRGWGAAAMGGGGCGNGGGMGGGNGAHA